MISRALLVILAGCLPGTAALAASGDDSFRAPDSLVLKDGRTVRGLIIRNTADAVLLQEQFGEKSYPKSEIVRIRDEADLLYTETARKGDLPAWRIIANDLRTLDQIKSLVEIPATTIEAGEFRHVPYKSFRVNGDVELNIYGDPEDPAAIELGIYGPKSSSEKLRRTLRGFLAGYLTTRGQVGALYALDLHGGIAEADGLVLEITPATAEDAFGAWWISLYNRRDLAAARLSPAEYARLTRPASEVIDAKGRVIANGWTARDIQRSERVSEAGSDERVMLRGFYRDKNGDFRLLGAP